MENNNAKTSIIIISYNACEMMKENIYAIRKTVREAYHIYVIDNASTDGVAEWLLSQEKKYDDITVICNAENVGFPRACNQGVKLSFDSGDRESDIFILNNDTRLCNNSLYNLKQALYSSGEIGAVGAISNYAGNKQQIGVLFNTAEEYVQFGNQNNVVAKESDITRFYEERVRLCGFAMLIKRDVWNKAGGMDEDFSPGYFEDDDLSMKILRQGKRLLVCTNSFIYHAGSVGFSKNSKKDQIIAEHYQTFYNKYRFPILDYAYADNYKLDEIRYGIDEKFTFLEVGCKIGANLKYVNTRYTGSTVYGIESDANMKAISAGTDNVYETVLELINKNPELKPDVVLSDEDTLSKMSDEEYEILQKLCTDNCQIILKSGIDFSKYKAIVWEEKSIISDIKFRKDIVSLIMQLSDSGILNIILYDSVGRGNNEKALMSALEGYAIYTDYTNVGVAERFSEVYCKSQIEAENIMFISDETDDLNSTDSSVNGITASDTMIVADMIDYVSKIQRLDMEHNTMKIYKEKLS